MADALKIPAFKVAVTDGAGNRVLEKTFTDGPGNDQTFIDHQYGTDEWDRLRVRQKTDEGHVLVTFRQFSDNARFTQSVDGAPGKPAECRNPRGQLFRITVEALPKSEWKRAKTVAFQAPAAEIKAEANGWWVSFRPNQWPCVCTVAVDAKGSKDEKLPSFPFPASPRFAEGRFFLAKGQFEAVDGGTVRLGVRGTGLSVRVALPAAGETKVIDPGAFKVEGAAQPEFLTDEYVAGKYAEKAAQVAYL